MTGQQLKNSILQMAVQGKLVPQDPNDEPASVLLERIRAEKEKLIKEGKIKKEKNPSVIFRGADNLPYEKIGKNEPVCIADEVPFEIPESWEWVRLKQIAISELGKTLDKSKNTGLYCPYLCSINVYWSGIDLSTVKQARFEDSELPKYRLKRGDLLICEGGDVGRSAVWDKDDEMYYQNALHRVRFYGGIDPYFFKMLLECYKSAKILDKCSKGMTIKHLVQSALNSIYFPLPPLNEQRRIIEKINQLTPYLEKYNIAETKLSKLNLNFPVNLKQAILQYAVQGKLVPQDPTDEPASVLLERIRAEKEQLIKSGKIKRDKHESVIFRRDNSYYERVDGIERCIDEEIPFEIPESWEWVRLNSISKILNGDRGKNYPSKSTLSSTGIPFISALNLDGNTVVQDENLLCMTEEQYNRLGNGKLIKNDIVVCIRGSLGKHGRYPFEKGAIASSLTILRPYYLAESIGDYIMLWLDSPAFFEQIRKYDNGTAQPNLAAKSFEQFLIPLPPHSEQHRIIAKVEMFFSKLKTL